MSTIPLRYRHWSYVWIPIVTGLVWFGMLWAMLIVWLAQGRPKYASQDGSIAYISDVGADILKPLFIVGCSITGVGFFLCLVVERYLRHSEDNHGRALTCLSTKPRLMPHMRRREKVFSTLAAVGAAIGGAGLIFLSIFDTLRYTSAHRVFLLVFMLGVALSAIFTIVEYRWIKKDFALARELKIAYIAKALIASALILLAIAFGITLYYAGDVGAILEWTIAMLFTFYVFTYYYDLRLSKGIQKGELHALKNEPSAYAQRA
ncbi:hypothetical protein FA13DRAFT_1637708 [Coprinellus micaceus]|uniref:CWH43-like N-terminal domain-containing protein n=1 Tax=Coprinellus micaceus TaxID=71717 RepID=A0A4Y7SVC9_COPMI|nr:hypothetical protein FA13DRAFT_1637708 [Coprinellus micaceus]